MRYEVLIEQRTLNQDSAGEQDDEWLFVARRRASIENPVPGSEFFASQQRQARVPTTFRMRFIDESEAVVLPDMRLKCQGKTYDIVSAVDPDGMRSELIVTALERVGED